jgi:hypothetical protein
MADLEKQLSAGKGRRSLISANSDRRRFSMDAHLVAPLWHDLWFQKSAMMPFVMIDECHAAAGFIGENRQ